MPTLNWIGKEQVVNHDKEVPFRLLKKIKSLSVGESSQNLIVHGDNLEALKALMPYYYGKIKCIYIDPPYNTGNEGWVYNDKVNSPKIKRWLGKVVGGESEDLCRHDKWLCMMYPRLRLLRDLLSNEGIIFISIDDNEQGNLKLLLDEIFGLENFVSQLIWKKKQGGGNDSNNFVNEHEYILVYAKKFDLFKINLDTEHVLADALYPFKDEHGEEYGLVTLDKSSIRQSDSLIFDIKDPEGNIYQPRIIKGKRSCWRWGKDKVKCDYDQLVFKNGKVYTRYYRPEGVTPKTLLVDTRFGRTETGKEVLVSILQENIFAYPKPVELIEHLIRISCNNQDLILDSFAGSGTTGHAVLRLNKQDGGNRRFILIEMEDHVAKEITTERIKRVIKNESYDNGFEFCELDKPLFNEEGKIDEECTFEQLAQYVYFTETQTNLDKKQISKSFIGSLNETDYYLIFKERGKNILNKSFLKSIKKDDNARIIYADKCLLDEETLEKNNIQFKQIPYEVRIY